MVAYLSDRSPLERDFPPPAWLGDSSNTHTLNFNLVPDLKIHGLPPSMLLLPPTSGVTPSNCQGQTRRSAMKSLSIISLLQLASPTFALASSMASDIAVVGCGVLGTSLCHQLLASPEFSGRSITGITKTNNRHESILEKVGSNERFSLTTAEELGTNSKFKDVVFCAPPSGFDDYPAAVEDAATNIWAGPSGGGSFVFTSSGGIYGSSQAGETVNEDSPTADPETNPRSAKLINAEKACIKQGGCCLRLAGLYLLERGAHNYWLNSGKDVAGRPDGIINLLHYDDAASSCMAALSVGPTVVSGRTFLISDGNPTTRKGICESALKAKMYADKTMPAFTGGDSDPLGKIYDGSVSDAALKWAPKYASFDEFMSSFA